MSPIEAAYYLRRLAADERQRLVSPKVKTTPYIEALELAISTLDQQGAAPEEAGGD